MVHPAKTLLLLFYIACIMAVVMVFSPGTLSLGDTVSINVFSFNDVFPAKQEASPQVDLTEKNQLLAQIDSMNTAAEAAAQAQEKAAKAKPQGSPTDSAQARPERFEPVIDAKFPIQFADSTSPLHLDRFFASLYQLSQRPDLVRILHYGDSQIEGDRVSEYLRARFHRRFGGCGVGLVPLVEKQASRSTLRTEFAPNLSKYAIYGDNRSNRGGRYGLLASAFRFSPPTKADSLGGKLRTFRSWARFRSTSYPLESQSAAHFENIKLVYASPYSNLAADISVNGDTTFNLMLNRSAEAGVAKQNIKGQLKKITINLESTEGSELFGVALDCNQGVAVDNVAMRGSSGVEFTKMNAEFIRKQIEQLNVKLIVLQFGVNVVPNVLSDYTFYENLLYRQLRFFKSIAPQTDILVVGVSDMSRRRGTQYESYPNVPRIREAQRRAAFRAGCAFWDLYEAMGGQGAMVSWVRNRPALATTDYTHFTPRGARLVGEMLYNALIKEYDLYKKRNQLEDAQ